MDASVATEESRIHLDTPVAKETALNLLLTADHPEFNRISVEMRFEFRRGQSRDRYDIYVDGMWALISFDYSGCIWKSK